MGVSTGVIPVSTKSVLKTVRVSTADWERWREAAGGGSLNGWIRDTLNDEANRLAAERGRAADEVAKRERLKAAARGLPVAAASEFVFRGPDPRRK